MEGFTPTFFLQVLVAVGTAGAVYGAVKADLKNMHRRLEEEIEARKEHSKADDQIFHDIRGAIGLISNKVAHLEGADDLAERIAAALKR